MNVPPKLLEKARELRKTQTDAESLLWHLLRNRSLCGFKFRRQHPFIGYVLDFFCDEASLAVELDGGGHNEPEQLFHDQRRTTVLRENGINVIRFWNYDVLNETETVLETILSALTPTLSQREREKK